MCRKLLCWRLYKSQVDNQGFEWIIDDLEHSYLYGFYTNYFRLATEEEILKAKYGITGIGSKKAEGKLGEMISQRMESAKAKEALLNDGELSEFEKTLAECINRSQCSIITPEGLAVQWSDELLSIAEKEIREKIAREIASKIEDMANSYYRDYIKNDVCEDVSKENRDSFVMGAESVLNKIKKGD